MKKAIFFILVVGLFSCTNNDESKIDDYVESNYYEVNKNETFDVPLIFNASTGYSWKWVDNQTDKSVELITNSYAPTKSGAEVIGGGGYEIWKFKAVKAGTYILKFEYCPSLDLNSSVETRNITIKIN
ncbi:inhibitor of cysteine peptidase [Flavobacterium sp. 7E]|uniref:protease inhibitor I42 family protein n=1 Tax=unclassified Flavobacterium TaxID=196869 RepID=UPI0015709BE9|nr:MULTISPECIES: protease inhibitor I42 family protein [unclassified Flavobacterium]MBE0392114.1 hypothetical protein [Flavobacterium sp. PL002]NRS87977.1 inhibitor of cysteine peptidase [Flavobacterium sp. 7E]